MLKVGQTAPFFEGLNQHGIEVALTDYRDKWILVYFYPQDETPGCIKEACGFRDIYPKLKTKLALIGVSADSVKSHHTFAQNHQLPFTLISDPSRRIIKAYQAWGTKNFMGKKYQGILRISYLINPERKISKVYDQVISSQHAQEVWHDINLYYNQK